MLKKNAAQLALQRRPVKAGVIVISAATKLLELARLVTGLQYVSESERPFVTRQLVASASPYLALMDGVTGSGLEEDDSFRWLRPDVLAATPPAVLSPVMAGKIYRALLTFFGGVQNAYSLKLGDSPVKRLVFVGRWRPDGPWLVLQAEVIET